MIASVIYVSGPYRSDSINGIHENIQHAREAAIRLWRAGWIVLCPHLNTAFMDGINTDQMFLQGDLELLRRCDAIYMLKGFENSKGALEELDYAKQLERPVLYESDDWLPSPFDLDQWELSMRLNAASNTTLKDYSNGTK